MRFADRRLVGRRDPGDGSIQSCSLLDCFAHVGGASRRPEQPWARRITAFRRPVAYVEAGGDWMDPVTPDGA